MGYSTDHLLARLQELEIDFNRYDHPVVMTVEAAAKYVGHLEGGMSKNLFLKDKKHRYYVVSALTDANVDLKVLSQRLGLGKGGLRMAPEEALKEILQVPLGCVTPFALINDSAKDVSLLLDQGFKAQKCCYFHPLSNDVTISLKAEDLDKLLVSIGKVPAYVDFKAEVTVGKDQPPDLAAFVPSTPIQDPAEKTPSVKTSDCHVAVKKPEIVTVKAVKQSNPAPSVKGNSQGSVQPLHTNLNVGDFVDQIINKTSSLVLAQITSDNIQQHGEQLRDVVLDCINRKLSVELESLTMKFKNAAYTQGRQSALPTAHSDSRLMNQRCLP